MHDEPKRVGKVEDLHCPSCDRPTAHTILAAYDTSWDVPDMICGGAKHDFLRCNGCGAGTYRMNEWSSEGDPRDRAITHYPPRGGHARQPKGWHHVPWKPMALVYKQTVNAFNSSLFTLAGAGVRLIIEGVCIDQKVVDGPVFDANTGNPILEKKSNLPVRRDNLEGKINGLVEQYLISPNQAKYLHEIRFLGNDAAHRLDIPDVDVINHAIDIVEHILDQVYEQPEKAKAVAARTRPPKV